MAYLQILVHLIVTIFFSMHLSHLSMGSPHEKALIDKICGGTHNYIFCVQALASGKPPTLDLIGYGYLSLNLAKVNATDTHVYTHKLLNNETTPPKLKHKLKLCHQLYEDALADIQNSTGDLDSKDYGMMSVEMLDAANNGIACEKLFKGQTNGDHILTQRNYFLSELCGISQEIADLLGKSA